jgi:hypothetical protein
MKLSALQLKTVGDSVELSWNADNRPLQLKISGVGTTLPGAADAAFASCLMPAMLLGQELRVDDSFLLSPELKPSLERFQQFFCAWFEDMHKIDLHIEPHQISAQPITTAGNAVFYSGGIDASYSFFELKAEIDHLIFCLGLDIQLDETERCRKALEGALQFANHYGKNLIVIETNFRAAFSELSAKKCQVVLLITYSLALGLRRLYVPASNDAAVLVPYQTHPLTDPLLTNGATEVIHHGMVNRVEKTLSMAASAQALVFLRVCNSSDQYNCGECEKCLRTMATLLAIGKQSTALPVLDDVAKLRQVKIWTPGIYHIWLDIQCCAEQHGAFALAKEVRKLCRAYEWKQFLKLAKQHFAALLTDMRYFFAR